MDTTFVLLYHFLGTANSFDLFHGDDDDDDDDDDVVVVVVVVVVVLVTPRSLVVLPS